MDRLEFPVMAVHATVAVSIDNRPAHRILYAYASLLAGKHPRLAAKWFRSLVFINPADNMGARFYRERGGWE